MLLVPPPVVLSSPVEISFRESRLTTGNNSSVTWSGVSWGSGGRRRALVAMVANYNLRNNTPRTVSGVTIGGTSAAAIAVSSVATATTAWEVVFYALRDLSGDSKDVVVSFAGGAGSFNDQGIWLGAWSLYNVGSLTPVSADERTAGTSSATITLTVSTSKGGAVLAGAVLNRNTSFTTANATERFDTGFGSDTGTAVGGDATTTGASVSPAFTKATANAAIIMGCAVALR